MNEPSEVVIHRLAQEVALHAARAEAWSNEVFSSNVEIDNLRKMVEDLRQDRDAALEREGIYIVQAIEAIKARDAERERCAKIAETQVGGTSECCGIHVCSCPAAAIVRRIRGIPLDGISFTHPLEKLVDETMEGGTPT